jgi:hypothetical protein
MQAAEVESAAIQLGADTERELGPRLASGVPARCERVELEREPATESNPSRLEADVREHRAGVGGAEAPAVAPHRAARADRRATEARVEAAAENVGKRERWFRLLRRCLRVSTMSCVMVTPASVSSRTWSWPASSAPRP